MTDSTQAIPETELEGKTQAKRDIPLQRSLSDMLQAQSQKRLQWIAESQNRQAEIGRKAGKKD